MNETTRLLPCEVEIAQGKTKRGLCEFALALIVIGMMAPAVLLMVHFQFGDWIVRQHQSEMYILACSTSWTRWFGIAMFDWWYNLLAVMLFVGVWVATMSPLAPILYFLAKGAKHPNYCCYGS